MRCTLATTACVVGVFGAFVAARFGAAIVCFFIISSRSRQPLPALRRFSVRHPPLLFHISERGLSARQSVGGRGRLTSIALDHTAAIEWGRGRDILHALAVARLPGRVPDRAADIPSALRAFGRSVLPSSVPSLRPFHRSAASAASAVGQPVKCVVRKRGDVAFPRRRAVVAAAVISELQSRSLLESDTKRLPTPASYAKRFS